MGRRPAANGGAAEVGASHQPVQRSAASRWLRRVAKQLIFPDTQIGWYPAATAGGMRLVRERPFDLVFSSAFPITSHLVARTLKRRSSLPWVAEFRDPWSDDAESRAVAAAALRVERSMAAEADAVVLPNQTFAEYYARRWGVDASVIGHGSDTAFPRAVPRPNPPVLAHVGSYLPGRQRLETLWSALAEMRRRGEAVPRLRWVGELSRRGACRASSGTAWRTSVEVTGFVSQSEALRLMSEASGLIACGFAETRALSMGTTPAKLLEYLASGVPVIYVGHPDGAAARMLGDYPGCHTVPFGDVEGAIRAVGPFSPMTFTSATSLRLSRRARTAELAALFDTVVGERADG